MLDWRAGSVLLTAYPPPKGSLRCVSFDDSGDGAEAAAVLVLRARTDTLREPCIPSRALRPFLETGVINALGELRHLSMVVDPVPKHDWAPLAKLTDVEAVCLHLEGVQITVWPMESSKKDEDFAPLDAETARALLAALTALDPAPRVPIRVFGFPQRALEDLTVVEGSGVRVEFETSTRL